MAKWTKEACLKEAQKYSSRAEWRTKDNASYLAAKKRKEWYIEATGHMAPLTVANKWTKETITLETQKFSSLKEWREQSNSSYMAAKRLKIFKSLDIYTSCQRKRHSLEQLHEEAKKYSTRVEFYHKNQAFYVKCVKHPRKEELFSHMEHQYELWTKEKAFEIAKQFKSKKELTLGNNKCKDFLQRSGLMKELSPDILPERIYKYTKEEIMASTKGFKYRSEWKLAHPAFSDFAYRNGFLEEAMQDLRHMGNSSIAEREILTWVQGFYPNATSKRFPKYELDIFIPEINLAIEYNGLYWHGENLIAQRLFSLPFEELEAKQKAQVYKYHINKTLYFKDLGITVIHIWEHEWATRPDQVKNFLYGKLRLGKSIGARKCEFKPITNKEAKVFCEQNHIQGAPSSTQLALGAFYGGELITVTTFSQHHRQRSEIVLNRMCSKFGVHVAGALSKMSKMAVNHFGCEIKTWVHLTLSDGQSYVKAGWEIMNKLAPDYFYQRGSEAFSKQSHKKSCIKLKYPEVYDPTKTERQMTVAAGLQRIWDCGKYTLIFKL